MTQESTVNLKDLLFVLRRHLLIILAITAVTGAAFFLVARFMLTKVYESQATLIVSIAPSDSSQTITGSDIALSQSLVNTYAIILKGNTLLSQVKQDLSLSEGTQSLANQITVSGIGTTSVLQLTVRDSSPARAVKIANEVVKYAPAEISRTVKTGSVEVISPPTVDSQPVSPNVKMITVVGLILGLFVTAIAILLFDIFDDKLRSEDDIRETLGYAVIGLIPDIEMNERKSALQWIKEKQAP